MDFSSSLIAWYLSNKQNYPWRETSDPYKIWVSEIILQQTKIKQGLPYYLNFIKCFETSNSLAKSPIQDVLSVWQGLGYYSRARNMHYAANQIINEFNGVFPQTYTDILKLKGVGKYTASAIASFAFKEYKPVIDGNVIRLITRIYGIYENSKSPKIIKDIEKILVEKISECDSPDIFNQAIMEFGQQVCLPSNPDCKNCIFNSFCVALKENKVSETPITSPRKEKKERYFNYLVVVKDGHTFIQKRQQMDIWKELFEFPLFEQKNTTKKALLEYFGLSKSNVSKIKKSEPIKHILTHQHINTVFWTLTEITEKDFQHLKSNYLMVEFKKLSEYPFSTLINRYLAQNNTEISEG